MATKTSSKPMKPAKKGAAEMGAAKKAAAKPAKPRKAASKTSGSAPVPKLLSGGGQWMLVTLSTGGGGSLVSIGTAAGVVLMGVRNHDPFMNHLRWSWAIALGYVASILTHLWVNTAHM